jgi:hypothetical protein
LGGLVADNGYLLVALQLGVPAAMLFAFALVMGARRGAITGRQTNGEVNYEVRGIFLFLMVAMLFGGYWGLSGPMCVLLGIVAREDRFHNEQAHFSPVRLSAPHAAWHGTAGPRHTAPVRASG